MMRINSTRIAAYIRHLFAVTSGRPPIDELAQKPRSDDPASRCLNRPCDLSELMSRTIFP